MDKTSLNTKVYKCPKCRRQVCNGGKIYKVVLYTSHADDIITQALFAFAKSDDFSDKIVQRIEVFPNVHLITRYFIVKINFVEQLEAILIVLILKC